MEELLFFPLWMLAALPPIINVLKTWVPTLWRELLAGVIAIIATAYVIITTELTLQPGIAEGWILFLLLTGTRAAVSGAGHVVTAVQQKVPIVTSRGDEIRAAQRLGIFLLLGLGVWGGLAWAQDSLRVDTPVTQEPAGMNGIMVLLISQAVSRLVGWIWGKFKNKD